jgi:hypothetical protein
LIKYHATLDFFGSISGGRCEIRTHEELAPLPVFKTGAFNRSANLPYLKFNGLQGPHFSTCFCAGAPVKYEEQKDGSRHAVVQVQKKETIAIPRQSFCAPAT